MLQVGVLLITKDEKVFLKALKILELRLKRRDASQTELDLFRKPPIAVVETFVKPKLGF